MGLEIKDLVLETSGWQYFEGFIVVEEFNIIITDICMIRNRFAFPQS